MANPDSKSFHKLIGMNQTNRNTTSCFIVNGIDIIDAVQQRNSLKNYFEDLAVPKEYDHFDDDYLEMCELHVSLIRKLKTLRNETSTVPFTNEEVALCIKKLNTYCNVALNILVYVVHVSNIQIVFSILIIITSMKK